MPRHTNTTQTRERRQQAARRRLVANAESRAPNDAKPLGRQTFHSKRIGIRENYLLWLACLPVAEFRGRAAATVPPLPSNTNILCSRRPNIIPTVTPPFNSPVLPSFEPEPFETSAPLLVPPMPTLTGFVPHQGVCHDERVEDFSIIAGEPSHALDIGAHEDPSIFRRSTAALAQYASDKSANDTSTHPAFPRDEMMAGCSTAAISPPHHTTVSTEKGKGKAIAAGSTTLKHDGVVQIFADSPSSHLSLPEAGINSKPQPLDEAKPGSSGASTGISIQCAPSTAPKPDDFAHIADTLASILLAQPSKSMRLEDLLGQVKDFEGEWGPNWLKGVFKIHDFLVQTGSPEGVICRYEQSFDNDSDRRLNRSVRFNAERSARK
ncbi:hypothetical protein BD410DRAFT_792248 [Rickenella mellea]|uniref:Uncharacterized protein n=1 Tax=Rickenella mellea TaxID=50990 RepID=A0A4Y7PVK0_9AGAM|nr:hypothetical protein BD410DRAFT_792248 [Rickenella mellea]